MPGWSLVLPPASVPTRGAKIMEKEIRLNGRSVPAMKMERHVVKIYEVYDYVITTHKQKLRIPLKVGDGTSPKKDYPKASDIKDLTLKDGKWTVTFEDGTPLEPADTVEVTPLPGQLRVRYAETLRREGWRVINDEQPTEGRGKTSEAKPWTMTEYLLFKMARDCPQLDAGTRKPPSHWAVFQAAWAERMTPYEMERKKKWKRRTAQERLKTVEVTFLGGQKVEDIAFDSGLNDNVDKQLEAGRQHGAKIHAHELLDNTKSQEEQDD